MIVKVKCEVLKTFKNGEGKTFGNVMIREVGKPGADVVLVSCPATTPLGIGEYNIDFAPKFGTIV